MLNYITWTANPVFLEFGPFTVRWYGLMFVIGFMIGYKIVDAILKHEGMPEKWEATLLAYLVIGTIIGSRLGHVFFYAWDYYKYHPIEILYTWEGGLSSHGGTIALIIAMILYSKFVTKKPPLWIFDRVVIPIALVGGLIRLGNLMNHEIYGHATSMPWGFRFVLNVNQWMHGSQPIFSDPSHPTQIYEALCYFALFALLMWMYWKKNSEERPGLNLGVFFIGIFASRFFIEFIKNPQEEFERDMVLNMGQWLSIPFILFGIGLIIYAMNRPRLHLEFPNKFPEEPEDKGKKKKKVKSPQ